MVSEAIESKKKMQASFVLFLRLTTYFPFCEFLVHDDSLFSCCSKFSIFLNFWLVNYVCWCGCIWIYPAWSSLSFLHVQINVFNQIWRGFNNFLKHSFCPFCQSSPFGITMICIPLFDGVCDYWGSVHFFFLSIFPLIGH